jgi:hypothetical protein
MNTLERRTVGIGRKAHAEHVRLIDRSPQSRLKEIKIEGAVNFQAFTDAVERVLWIEPLGAPYPKLPSHQLSIDVIRSRHDRRPRLLDAVAGNGNSPGAGHLHRCQIQKARLT